MNISLFSLSIAILALLLVLPIRTQDTPFNPLEATIDTIHNALYTHQTTCHSIVSSFISRIEAYNPLINAIIALNPNALTDASVLDTFLLCGNASTPLFCIPIFLKDNYDAVGMPTTAGSAALNDSFPNVDAAAVTALKRAGAVILGKTNLHEFALEGLSVSSLGGQTVNPYDFSRTPGGSSGGTGAAVAASFAVFGTGTDTVNSLRSPASANSLYSFRPTYGLISRAGVVPVSWTQDTIGAIGRCLADIATGLTVMASIGYDPLDNATARIPSTYKNIDYTSALTGPSTLKDTRIGILTSFFNHLSSSETDPVNDLMASTISTLEAAGATIIFINDTDSTRTYNATYLISTLDVQQFEYRDQLTSYLSNPNLTGSHPKSMPELYTQNLNTTNFLVIPSQYRYLQNALISSTSNATYAAHLQQISNLTTSLHKTFTTNNLDVLIYPEQKNLVVPIGSPSQSGRNGILAALTGFPVITIPVGFSNVTESAPIGVPVGMEIMGLPWGESDLLKVAKSVDDRVHGRRGPVTGGMNGSIEVKSYEDVPVIKPLGLSNIDVDAYPLGTFGT